LCGAQAFALGLQVGEGGHTLNSSCFIVGVTYNNTTDEERM